MTGISYSPDAGHLHLTIAFSSARVNGNGDQTLDWNGTTCCTAHHSQVYFLTKIPECRYYVGFSGMYDAEEVGYREGGG